MNRPEAPLSLDLDNKWSYLQTRGDPDWTEYPSYLNIVLPRIESTLNELGLRLTFFLVGADAERTRDRDLFVDLGRSGHEIGNHSFQHEPWLHLYEPKELAADLRRAHEAIAIATGVEPVGFRGPGYSLSRRTIHQLSQMSYRYDATVLPNVLNPLGRAYYFMRSGLNKEQRATRRALFGTLTDATLPNVPFRWHPMKTELLEIPVSTVPGLRIPFHFSYLIFLAQFSERLAFAYLGMAIRLCKLRGVAPSLLLHPLDFLGGDDDDDLGFFPGMALPAAKKLDLTRRLLVRLAADYDLMPITDYLDNVAIDKVKPLTALSR